MMLNSSQTTVAGYLALFAIYSGFLSLTLKIFQYGCQAVIKHIAGTGYESSDTVVIDQIELQRHQQLDKLYKSTRSARV